MKFPKEFNSKITGENIVVFNQIKIKRTINSQFHFSSELDLELEKRYKLAFVRKSQNCEGTK